MNEKEITPYEVMINEWEKTESLIRYFDDILVRLRLYGSTIYFVGLGFLFSILTADITIPKLGMLGLAAIASFIPLCFATFMFFTYKYYQELMHQAVRRVRKIEDDINDYLNKKDIGTNIELNKYVTKDEFPKYLKLSQEHWLFGIYIGLSLIISLVLIILRIIYYF